MKAVELKITMIDPTTEITRTICVPKRFSFDQLHQCIQIAFNFENIEYYDFYYNNRHINRDLRNHDQRKLLSLKENDQIEYQYGAIEPFSFIIDVLKIVDVKSEIPQLLDFQGNNAVETISSEWDPNKQTPCDPTWIAHLYEGFADDYQEKFDMKFKECLERLTQIRYFQDYVHNQIVQIECLNQRKVYFGADATDGVIINFHENSEKLMTFTTIDTSILPQSNVKYHDCIECVLIKKATNEIEEFDYTINKFGVLFSRVGVVSQPELPQGLAVLYLDAFEKYVQTIEAVASQDIKAQPSYMIRVDQQGKWQQVKSSVEVNLDLGEHISKLCYELDESFRNKETWELDVLSLLNRKKNEIETRVIVGNFENDFEDYVIRTISLKHLLFEITAFLNWNFNFKGICKVLLVRDKNLVPLLTPFCERLGIQLELVNKCRELDRHYDLEPKKSIEKFEEIESVIMKMLSDMGVDLDSVDAFEVSGPEELQDRLDEIKTMLNKQKTKMYN